MRGLPPERAPTDECALTPAALVDRLREACTAHVASLVARSFGGPHAAVRAAAPDVERACLDRAYTKGLILVRYATRQYGRCLQKAHAGGICDATAVDAKLAKREATTVTAIAAKCAGRVRGAGARAVAVLDPDRARPDGAVRSRLRPTGRCSDPAPRDTDADRARWCDDGHALW